jgi:hypothetical protein
MLRPKRRKARGASQIAELAPALLILFLLILFPLLDILYLAIAYTGGWYLNHMTSRACAMAATADWATTINQQKGAWLTSPFATFCGATVLTNTAVAGTYGGSGDPFVQVETRVQIRPFVTVPLLVALDIEGVSKPAVFRYIDKRPREETD